MKPILKYINYLDLFSGTGGFALGLKQAGFIFKKHYFSEIDVHASSNYLKNFKNAIQLGDIKAIGRKQIEKPDIITFGSPCQDISIAGKRQGLKGKRSGLFFEALRLIKLYRPRVFVFENVKGIFSSNEGKDFEAVLRAFADIGIYDLQWQLLNTAWFLPQNRERIYLVGHLRGEARPKIFPIGQSHRLSETLGTKRQENENIASTITGNYSKGVHGRGETYIQVLHWKGSKEKWTQELRKAVPTLKTQNELTRQSLIVKGAAYRTRSYAGKGGKIEMRKDSKANQLTTVPKDSMVAIKEGVIRRLTPRECERLQGFPDDWTKYGWYNGEQKEISDTQRYKMLGNAVSVVAVKAVGQRLLKNNSELGGLMKYTEKPEIVLSGVVDDFAIPELSISYTRNNKQFLGTIYRTADVANFFRNTFNDGEIEAQEYFVVLYLNTPKNIIGYYRHSKGMIDATMVDIRIILSTALKCLATSIIIAHNHPSQVVHPSHADIELTKKLKSACTHMNIRLLDHIIITPSNHYSFADNGLAGLEPIQNNTEQFIATVKKDLLQKKAHTKLSLEKLAASFGINDKTEVKELIELAIVETARNIAKQQSITVEEKYRLIVELYHRQVNLSHRTSQSILLQQYSTPAPIAFLMGIFCEVDKPGMYLEPSAGNGMLTIAGNPEHFCVNEIDNFRYQNLKQQGFYDVISTDATSSICSQFNRSHFDSVLTNPPFGKMDTKSVFDNYPIQSLEHVMAIRALGCMKDNGRAAIIIGGHTGWDAKGRMQAGKNRLFFNYLYSHYCVVDVIPINGKKLYSRQGTSFNTRLILINGRKIKPEGNAPVYDKERDTMVSSFDDLFNRVMEATIPETQVSVKPETPLSKLRKRYEKYLKLQEKYKDILLFLGHEDHYEVFGENAIVLAKQFGLLLSAEFLYNGDKVAVVRVKTNAMELLTTKLRRMNYRYALVDELQSPQQVEQERLEIEAKKLLQMLQTAGLGTIQEQGIWKLPLADFLKREQERHKILGWKPSHSMNYALPYKQEYVTLFQNIPYVDPYGHLRINPYSIEGSRNLNSWLFVKTCLKIIHKYEIRNAMKKNKKIPDKVLKSYPLLQLEQQALLLKQEMKSKDLGSLNDNNIDSLKPDKAASETAIKEQWYGRYKRSLYYQKKFPSYYIIVISDGEGLYEAFGNSAVLLSPDYMGIRHDGKMIDYFVFGASKLNHYRKLVREELLSMIVIDNPKDIMDSDLGTDNGNEDEIVDHETLFAQFLEKKAENPELLYLFEIPGTFTAFNEDAEALSRVCNIGLIKSIKNGAFQFFITGSSKSLLFLRLEMLKEAGYKSTLVENPKYHTDRLKEEQDMELNRILKVISENRDNDLGAPYIPSSNACIVLDTQVPDSMAYETQEALEQIKEAVGGDVDNFVRDRLGYPTKTALCKALSAEQTDAVMMAIYNIEARKQGMIIGDQTGIGKGRVAAAMIRYACHQGLRPVFLTEKANLFSDIYRDLYAIGSGRLKPFIVNGRESKTDIKDEDGNVVYQALPVNEQQEIFSSRTIPTTFNFVVATYSQFNSPEKKPEKPAFLSAIAENNIFIMDEAHNSSGSSNTGNFLQGVVSRTKGVVFLSATFAKRPDNMPIYAMKTAIADCNMSRDQLVESIQRGGVALQEVLSSQLVAEGQMLRRERSFEGVEVNYLTLTDKAPEHQAIADNITGIIRDIITFQKEFIDNIVEELDDIAVAEGKQVDIREGTNKAGVDNTPYFSKVFNIINQMLFSIKASSVAERAIERLKEGKKPVIAFSSTMGSFLEDMEDERGLPVSDGSVINPDFSEVLRRGLDGVMRYTERNADGTPEYKRIEVSELPADGQAAYLTIQQRIEDISTGITLSPIDVVIRKIRDAGYSVAEVTGRKYELQFNDSPEEKASENSRKQMALVLSRKKINTNDAFRRFNNNEVDVLMINQSGSTGASAHAIPTAKVPKEEVKQRVMIVLQAELDINTEVQKRGRINRTGQIIKPIYDYVSSAIPAESRLMMMLQKKLKSLDANTASNQKQSSKILDVPDFLNKYGDRIVKEYLLENPDVNRLLDDPLRLTNKTDSDQGDAETLENASHKVSGRVAVLSVKMQQDFYSEITERYNDYVAYLQQIGEYDLELEAMNLEAETINSKVVNMGNGSGSLFSEDSMLETVKANVLKKPFTVTELDNLITEALQGKDAQQLQQELVKDYHDATSTALETEETSIQERFDKTEQDIVKEKKYQKLKTEEQRDDYIKKRKKEIEEARIKAIKVSHDKAAARQYYLDKIFRFFYIGRKLNFPVDNFNGYKEFVLTVFLGFILDKKNKTPYLPSRIKLRFALASSSKYFAIPASYDDINSIIGASNELPEITKEDLLQQWEKYISENNTDRKTRHIITGNLLQAFSDYKGKLVSYTTIDGKVNKGILMPDNWVADEQVQDKVSVPVLQALPIIKSLVAGKHITTDTGIGFLKHAAGWYKIIVPMSRKAGGEIFLDKQLLELVDGNNFQKSSDKMTATVLTEDIDKFVEVIQNKHSCAVTITRYQFSSLERQDNRLKNRKAIRLPEPEKEYTPGSNVISMLELEAEALTLKLRLIAA